MCLKQEESADIVNIAICLYKPKTSKHESWKNRTMSTTQTHGAHNTLDGLTEPHELCQDKFEFLICGNY